MFKNEQEDSGSGRLFDRASQAFRELQERIVLELEAVEGRRGFRRDRWERGEARPAPAEPGTAELEGGGITAVIEGGRVFEKGGVAFSNVRGRFTRDMGPGMPGGGDEFEACGISLVLHPTNPYVPTVHMNLRRIERGTEAWFGGGADLTPCYLEEEDAVHFHRCWRAVCAHHPAVADYAGFKRWCDEYFYIPHRGEARGIGGIFFDWLSEDPEETFDFVQEVGDAFLESYLPIVERHRERPYTERERHWQRLRRGRYVEFNLVCDRGTTFGLRTGGRTESILMSMPPEARWSYDHRPAPGSAEAKLLTQLVPRDWAGLVD